VTNKPKRKKNNFSINFILLLFKRVKLFTNHKHTSKFYLWSLH